MNPVAKKLIRGILYQRAHRSRAVLYYYTPKNYAMVPHGEVIMNTMDEEGLITQDTEMFFYKRVYDANTGLLGRWVRLDGEVI